MDLALSVSRKLAHLRLQDPDDPTCARGFFSDAQGTSVKNRAPVKGAFKGLM